VSRRLRITFPKQDVRRVPPTGLVFFQDSFFRSDPGCQTARDQRALHPAALDAMQIMQATLEELSRGQQLASSFLPIGGKLLKARRGEVAERLNAAVC
jgi:hypothetical protein